MHDKVIQMYVYGGNPNGRIICELSNWNGRVYKIPRSELLKFGEQNDAEFTGVYFLFGKDDNNRDTLYVGEAERILTRLKQHLKDKDYWNECISIVSKDNSLNKAHVKFLENKFYSIAQEAARANILNTTVPTCSSISIFDSAILEEFIDNSKLLVNALGYKVFDSVKDIIEKETDNQDVFYINAARGANAKGMISSEGFVVLKDSEIASSTVESIAESIKRFRVNLIEEGTIDANNIFTKDYIFSSPSLAAAVVLGRNANGRTEWKNEKHKSIKDIEEK